MIYVLEDDGSIRELIVYALSQIGLPTRGFDRPSALYAALAEIVARNGGSWCVEAEEYLLAHAPRA